MIKKYLKLFKNNDYKSRQLIKKKVNAKFFQMLSDQNFQLISESHPDDIFIAGYPKSGNTWVQNLIAGVIYGIDTALLPDKLTQELVPDVHAKPTYKRFSSVTFFKTHDVPKPKMKRVIHLIRDGRDVISSYYAMNKALKIDVTLDKMIKDGTSLYPCKWHEHTRQWLNNPYDADLFVLKYEDLINEPFQSLKNLLNYFNIERSDEIIIKSIEGNSFKEMQRKEEKYGWYNQNWDKNEKFIRKGKIGSYKTEIPKDLITYFENEAQSELRNFYYIK